MSEHNERTEARKRDKNKKKPQQTKAAAGKFPQLKRPYLPQIAAYQVRPSEKWIMNRWSIASAVRA